MRPVLDLSDTAPVPALVGLQQMAKLAPRPTTLAETGLSATFLGDLVSKHLLAAGVLAMSQMVERLALSGTIIEQVLQFLRKEARVEVRAAPSLDAELRFGLTERGRLEAQEAMQRSGYVGPAPVSLEKYREVIARQSIHGRGITRSVMHERFANVVLAESLLDQLGAAMNSGRAIFLHGAAGTGKSYVAKRLYLACESLVLVPHAVLVNDAVVQVFDPQIHRLPEGLPAPTPLWLEHGFDLRFARCERPNVIVGGELTLDMLEVRYEPSLRLYSAPLQMKANNGIFIVDDLGRQRMDARALFNRWIVPMEERTDHLGLANGVHFSVPFDVVLVFSTNLRPLDILDDAFLRRIGHKIAFRAVDAMDYHRIWEGVCAGHGITCDAGLVDFVIHELHEPSGVPMLACHPRDLVSMALDRHAYRGGEGSLDKDDLRWAWTNYHVAQQSATGTGG